MSGATRGCLAVVVLAACGAGADAPDARGGDAWPACLAGSLEVGRCVGDGGAPCTGGSDEVRGFAPLAVDTEVAAIVGPQGSAMFVLAVRTTGIVAGDPADPASPDNPLVDLVLATASDAQVARYRGRAGFVDDGDFQIAAGLFVVLDADPPTGTSLRALGNLTDALDAHRCGESSFIAR